MCRITTHHFKNTDGLSWIFSEHCSSLGLEFFGVFIKHWSIRL